MRKFVTSCKDDKTGYEMILSECSYNEACMWLENELSKYGSEIYRTEKHTNGLMYIWTGIYRLDKFGKSSCIAKRMFFYDEERGYLLGE